MAEPDGSSGSNLAIWADYTAEDAQHDKELADASSSEFFKWKVGRSVVRFLPPLAAWSRKSPFVPIPTHYIRIAGGDDVQIPCPKALASKFCPICGRVDQLRASGNAADFEAAKDLFARRRVHCVLIDRENPEVGPRVAVIGKTIHDQLIAIRRDVDAGGNFLHPESGFDIVVERKGTGKNDTEYTALPARRVSPLSADPAQAEDWLKNQPNVERYAVVLTSEQIKEKIKRAAKVESANSQPPREVNRPPARTVASDVTGTAIDEDDLPF